MRWWRPWWAEENAKTRSVAEERDRYRKALEEIATPPYHLRMSHEIAASALEQPREGGSSHDG